MNELKNMSAGYEDIKVTLLDFHQSIAKHIWDCYRMTWRNLQNVEYDVSNPICIEAVRNVIAMRALPMPREQALFTFKIENISRVCLAQLTRQRKAAFNVESQMPQSVGHNVIVPLNIMHDKNGFATRAKELIKESQLLYDDMIKAGVPYQDARYLLMHGQTTSCVYVVDINTFVSSFGMRCENNLSDEINLVYRLCLKAIYDRIELCRKYCVIDSLTDEFYNSILKNCDCMGAKARLGLNTDKVFGNSFMRFNDGNEDVTNATKNSSCDFKKSAWYAELIKIYDEDKFDLLFDGEKEMIEGWKEVQNDET